MPELPEVETVVRSIALHVRGRAIKNVALSSRRVTRGGLQQTAKRLVGRTILRVRRRGKQIFFDLDKGILYIHLGMTGKLLWNAEPGKYTRAVLELDNGLLIYDDVRQFGRFEYFEKLPKLFERTGPDALDISFSDFQGRLTGRKGQIKSLLLNQSFLAGVGNIYADEILFAARIHPTTSVARISKRRSQELHRQLMQVLHAAIEHRGSSISDYVDGAGARGNFQQLHNVYGRTGEPCPRCGTPVRRVVIAQRGTHYCPRCQRA